MTSSHVQTPAAKPASPQQETLDTLAGIVADYVKEHLTAMTARMAAALGDVGQQQGDPQQVYQRVKSARLLKDNAYAFFHLASGAIDAAVRRELGRLSPQPAAKRPSAATLSLVPLEEMDSRLALGALARPFDIAHSDLLATLAVRLGMLLGRGVLRADSNPFRPDVFLGAIDDAWREFEPEAEAHGLVQLLLRPEILFDFAPLLDALVAALRKVGQPGSVDAYRIQKTDGAAAAKAARAGQRAALAEQLRKLFGDDGGDDGVPLIPDLPTLPSSGGGWRPSGAGAFAAPPAQAGQAPDAVRSGVGAAAAGGLPAGVAVHGGPNGTASAAHAVGTLAGPGVAAVAATGAGVQPAAGFAAPSGASAQPAAGVGPGATGQGAHTAVAPAAGFGPSAAGAGSGLPPQFVAGNGQAPVANAGQAGWSAAVQGTLAQYGGAAPLLDVLARIEPVLAHAVEAGAAAPSGGATGALPHNVFYLPRLKQSLPQGSLPRRDERTLDLLSRVFETVLLDDSIPPRTRELLQVLQVPVLKAALLDKNFFFEEAHPARRLVDLMSRVGWEQHENHDDPLFQAMQRSVARVGEAQPDAFANAVAELEAGIAADETAQDEALAAPVASAIRQEKRDVAARQARDAIALRVQGGGVVDVVSGFLEQRWATVLTFAYTIEDTRPGAVGNATRAMDDLIWSVKPKATQEQRKALIARLPRLLATLNKWLDAIKWQDAERLQFFARLAEYHAAIVRAPIELSPERQLELAVEAAQQDALRRVELENAALDRAAAREAEVSAVDGLERGMWLEFRTAEGARKVKLAWVSPLRTLFIFSGAGRREAFSLSAEKLAAALNAGNARVLAIDGVVGQVLSEAMAQGAVNDPSVALAMP
ncbi:DUF1631 domain-containing protein [Massilia sp. TW-1]|uniref:DUF1631 domain-containing protein n=1 Tax=Telluria antibiotica TaxID=2717319 RepID=A0ABX0P5V8_9BURK|nr:DUF1631 family protein [Telluria antibiotica]NIA52612.1 DUF1631 domain-containing protein [Telluria antibiotica]